MPKVPLAQRFEDHNSLLCCALIALTVNVTVWIPCLVLIFVRLKPEGSPASGGR